MSAASPSLPQTRRLRPQCPRIRGKQQWCHRDSPNLGVWRVIVRPQEFRLLGWAGENSVLQREGAEIPDPLLLHLRKYVWCPQFCWPSVFRFKMETWGREKIGVSLCPYSSKIRTQYKWFFFNQYCWVIPPCLVLLYFYFLINFYWSMAALQCYVSLHCTTKWISHTYRYPLPLDFPPILPQCIK